MRQVFNTGTMILKSSGYTLYPTVSQLDKCQKFMAFGKGGGGGGEGGYFALNTVIFVSPNRFEFRHLFSRDTMGYTAA